MRNLRQGIAITLGVVLFIFLVSTGVVGAAEDAPNPPLRGYPVLVAGREVFQVKLGVGSFSAEERAAAISKRLDQIGSSTFFSPDTPTIAKEGNQFNVTFGGSVLVSVTEADAAVMGRSQESLARYYAEEIGAALIKARTDFSTQGEFLSTLYAIISMVAMGVAIVLLRVFSRRAEKKLLSWRGTIIRNLRIQNVQVVSAEALTSVLVKLLHLTRFLLVLVTIYICVPLGLSFFPLTRNYAHILIGFVTTPLSTIGESLLSFVPDLFFMVVIGLVTHYALKLFKVVFNELQDGTIKLAWFYPEWAKPTYQLLRFLILALALISAFPYIPGSDSPAFKGISLFLGVLLSFASSSSISNIIAGVIITYTRGFKMGDRVQIGDTTGDIVETTLLVTRVRTIKNVVVTIPNASVMSSHIINFSTAVAQKGALILHTTVTIGYDAPWRQVHELLTKAAAATPNVLGAPAPFVLQTSLDDFYVSYQINAYTDKPSVMALTYSELHQRIQDAFNEAGVEIMSPHYANLRDGNDITIPQAKSTEGYEAPQFRVKVSGANNPNGG